MRQILAKALANIDPDISYSYYLGEDPKTIKWNDPAKTIPESEIDTEVIRLQAEYDAQAYARNRQAEYPSLLELTVALYDTDDKSAVEAKRAAVKAKYPKP